MNKLWILESNETYDERELSRIFSYDCNHGFVIEAADEAEARKIASAHAQDEGAAVWLNPEITTCVELVPDGTAGIVMSVFMAG